MIARQVHKICWKSLVHGSSRYRAVTSLFVHTGQANMSCVTLHLLHEQQQDENRGGRNVTTGSETDAATEEKTKGWTREKGERRMVLED